ncbi:hypothetical protein [Rhizobium leguminosarum]
MAILIPVGTLVLGAVLRITEEQTGLSLFGRPIFAIALVLVAMVAGFTLFVLRELERAVYGFIELVFGIAIICFTFFYQTRVATPTLTTQEFLFTISQLGGCLYLVVRGLDNLGQGLKRYPAMYKRWQWLSMAKVEAESKKLRYPWQKH